MNEPELVKPMREVCDDKRNDKLRDKLIIKTFNRNFLSQASLWCLKCVLLPFILTDLSLDHDSE